MEILKVDKEQNGTMDVRAASNNKFLGCFAKSEDGYYNFWPMDSITGFYSGDMLIELGMKLKAVNADWDKHLNEYFKSEQNMNGGDEQMMNPGLKRKDSNPNKIG